MTTPGPSTLTPYGTIQGRLTDRVTQQPIVGAVLSIGLASATTDGNGQFVLSNVPATVDKVNDKVDGTYYATIDLQRVTSPVAMASNPAVAYPKFAYKYVYVEYTSLDDTNGTTPGAGSGSNHDTPVVGLVAGFDLDVAKLSAAFAGVVEGCPGTKDELTPVAPGYIVRLLAASSDNSTTGADGHVVAVTTTIAAGQFSFDNVEAVRAFGFEAQDALDAFYGTTTAVSPADGLRETVVLHVCPTDKVGPIVVAVSPEAGADVSPATTTAATSVTFTFSEAIANTPAMSVVPGIPNNLYDLVAVNYLGQKSGNVAHTLAWNEARTVLTVTFQTAPSGKYWVRLPAIASFRDQYGNAGGMGVCPDDGDPRAATFGVPAVGGTDSCTAFFTTNGAPTASAPTSLVVVNANQLNAKGGRPQLDWLPATGAKTYNVYRSCAQWPASTNEPDPQVLVTNTALSEFTEPAPGIDLIEGDSIPLACTYTVKGVNSDKIENPAGITATVSDKVAPQILSATSTANPADNAAPPALFTDAANQFTITFNEDMTELAAETIANYTFTARPGGTGATETWPAPQVASIQYAGKVATFTFSAINYAIVPTNASNQGMCPTITPATGDTIVIPANTPTCVNGGAALASALQGDDVACGPAGNLGICAGPDGICNSPATGDDALVTRVGGIPRCITANSTSGILATPHPAGTIVLSSIAAVTAGTAITDVGGNAINPNRDTVLVSTGNATSVAATVP